MKILLIVGAVVYLQLVSSQSQCTRANLENRILVASLLADSLVAGGQTFPPNLNVLNLTIVCLAVNNAIDEYRHASLVVEYDCAGSCPDGNSGVVSQVEFGCNNNVWSSILANTNEGNVQTPPPQANLQTPLRSDCRVCLNTIREGTALEPNHCIPCSSCLDPGLNMCTGSGASSCCNVNISGQCGDSCPAGTVPDSNFICRASCDDPLPTAMYQSGVVSDPNCMYVGCTATYTCNEGLTLQDLTTTSYQLRCMEGNNSVTANWDANTRTCSQPCTFEHDADASARGITIEYEPMGCESMFGTTDCVASYTHNTGSTSCCCTHNETTGTIRCFSDAVVNFMAAALFRPTTVSSNTNQCPSCSTTTVSCSTSTVLASVISIISTAVLATVIFVLVQIALCKYHPKFTPGRAESAPSGEGQAVYEQVAGEGGVAVSDPTYMAVGARGGGTTMELRQNEAYGAAMELEQNEAYGAAMELEQNEAYGAAMELEQNEAYGAAMELEQNEAYGAAMELEQNEAYGTTVL